MTCCKNIVDVAPLLIYIYTKQKRSKVKCFGIGQY